MQSAVLSSEPLVLLKRDQVAPAPVQDSGFWGVREQGLESSELAAALALMVHRGIVAGRVRRILPVRG